MANLFCSSEFGGDKFVISASKTDPPILELESLTFVLLVELAEHSISFTGTVDLISCISFSISFAFFSRFIFEIFEFSWKASEMFLDRLKAYYPKLGVPMAPEKSKRRIVPSAEIIISDFTIGFSVVDWMENEVWLVDFLLECWFSGVEIWKVGCLVYIQQAAVLSNLANSFFCWKINPISWLRLKSGVWWRDRISRHQKILLFSKDRGKSYNFNILNKLW